MKSAAGIIAGIQVRIANLQKDLDALTAGKAKTADPVQFAQLQAAWNAANAGTKSQFLGEIGAQIATAVG
jgi:hypothetical protein